jgi:23S rRNA (pseudouridine1915-N3)-methyltransferase
MVAFRIISVGKAPKDWRDEAFQHYVRLISPYAKVETVAVREQKVSGSSGIERATKKETDALVGALLEGAYSVALDESGSVYSSIELSRHLESFFQQYSKFDFLIGGPHGFHPGFKEHVHEVVSLSHLTFPHDLAKVILAEQLYRAMAILNNLPYHK